MHPLATSLATTVPVDSNVAAVVVVIIGASAFVYAYFKAKFAKDTISIQQETITALQTSRDEQGRKINQLLERDRKKTEQISHLGGQIEMLKTLPLQSIQENMAAQTKLLETLTTTFTTHENQVIESVHSILAAITTAQTQEAQVVEEPKQ